MIFAGIKGAIIGGLLALAAGYLVFRGATRAADQQVAAAHAQTEALRQQNRDLRNEGRHRQAQDGIVAPSFSPASSPSSEMMSTI